MEAKDIISVAGIGVTFAVSTTTLIYTMISNKRTSFVNTVTSSRLKWIDSLRDKVSEFIAVTARLADTKHSCDEKELGALLRERDMLLHQIILHLNPHDEEDQKIRRFADQVCELTDGGDKDHQLGSALTQLRNVTAEYLKKEWNRVKKECKGKKS